MNKESEKSRIRNIQKKFWVSEEENELLKKKMELSGYDSFNEYIIHMGIDGFIIIQNYDNFIEVSKLLHNIGIDINKIAHRAETIELQEEKIKRGEHVEKIEPPISIADIEKIDKHMENIWKCLNAILEIQSGSKARDKNRKNLKKKIKEDKEKL